MKLYGQTIKFCGPITLETIITNIALTKTDDNVSSKRESKQNGNKSSHRSGHDGDNPG